MSFKISFDKAKKIARLELSVIKDIEQVISGEAVKTAVGKFAVERLRFQARTGKPFNEAGSFPQLKPSTIKNRAYLAKYNTTHPTFKVPRSNLTITGAFLNSLNYVFKDRFSILLKFDGEHPRYRGRSGFIGEAVKNSDLVKWLSEKGFKVFDNSLENNQQFVLRIRTIVSQFIRRGLRVRNRIR